MDARARRLLLLDKLKMSSQPLTGTLLAKELGISRQVIVGDIAILRAGGENVYATPQGYIIPKITNQSSLLAALTCCHEWDKLEEELAIIIDNGGKVLDVIVEHPVYGEMRANLMLSSRRELDEFLSNLKTSGAKPLSTITGGVHIHTIEVSSEEVLRKIEQQLKTCGILLK